MTAAAETEEFSFGSYRLLCPKNKNSDKCVIVFAGVRDARSETYEFKSTFSRIKNIDAYYVKDNTNSLYQNENGIEDIISKILDKISTYKNKATVGVSGGAFAAVFFSQRIKADIVVGFSPRSSVNIEKYGRRIGRNLEWFFDKGAFDIDINDYIDLERRYYFFFSDSDFLDLWDRHRFIPKSSMFAVSLVGSPHNGAAYLKEKFPLEEVFDHLLNGIDNEFGTFFGNLPNYRTCGDSRAYWMCANALFLGDWDRAHQLSKTLASRKEIPHYRKLIDSVRVCEPDLALAPIGHSLLGFEDARARTIQVPSGAEIDFLENRFLSNLSGKEPEQTWIEGPVSSSCIEITQSGTVSITISFVGTAAEHHAGNRIVFISVIDNNSNYIFSTSFDPNLKLGEDIIINTNINSGKYFILIESRAVMSPFFLLGHWDTRILSFSLSKLLVRFLPSEKLGA